MTSRRGGEDHFASGGLSGRELGTSFSGIQRRGLTGPPATLYIVHRHYTMRSEPLIRIDVGSPIPAYEQIAGEIRTLLVSGQLAPGSRLPTVRQVALDLSVHHNTVAQAYRVLAAEGWLELRRGRGVRVVERAKPAAGNRKARRSFEAQLKRLLAKAAAEGISPSAIAQQLLAHAQNVRNWVPAKGR